MQQQHRLPPSCVDLIPLHRNAGQPTQAEVVDGAKLAAVPGKEQHRLLLSAGSHLFLTLIWLQTSSCVPDMKSRIENVCFLESIQLNLAVTHLVVDAFQLIVQLQLLPFELAVLLLVPCSMEQAGLLDAVSSTVHSKSIYNTSINFNEFF